MTEDKQAIEAIANIIDENFSPDFTVLADEVAVRILQTLTSLGYVKLAEQKLPELKQPPKTGAELIAVERERQMSQEGWTAEHDDQHTDNELARVGAIYALPPKFRFYAQAWPVTWSREWYKPTPTNRIKELTKAGALIAAEIDRLQRICSQ